MEQPQYTDYAPTGKPLLIWDGNCGFCKYWIIKWKQFAGDTVEFDTYQNVASRFKDLPESDFKKAVHLVDTNGRIYRGAAAAFHSIALNKKMSWLDKLYQKSALFRQISENVYKWIADHRPFMYQLSVKLFGKNPARMKPYWMYYGLSVFGMGVLTALIRKQ